jgi:RNA polymerase sigma-70 factor, ECF subfamily
VTEAGLIAAARAGDEAAFRELTDRHARELHVHCYRMLGSIHDAEDALQDSLFRAWRHLSGFEGRSSFRAWLYRIATNVCLAATTRRAKPEHDENIVLTPYPDTWLDELPSDSEDPSARYDRHESVQLAFLAAVQTLPPRQRAVLLLRDVLGFSAREAAELLDASPTSVHSALRRARATLERRQAEGRLELDRTHPPDDVERSLVQRYVQAWESIDVAALLRLLRQDAVMTMPPDPAVFIGSRAIVDFFATVPAGGALDRIPLLPTRANRQPAVAAYALDPDAGLHRPYGIMVLSLDGDAIAEITGCSDPNVFAAFGLPSELTTP